MQARSRRAVPSRDTSITLDTAFGPALPQQHSRHQTLGPLGEVALQIYLELKNIIITIHFWRQSDLKCHWEQKMMLLRERKLHTTTGWNHEDARHKTGLLGTGIFSISSAKLILNVQSTELIQLQNMTCCFLAHISIKYSPDHHPVLHQHAKRDCCQSHWAAVTNLPSLAFLSWKLVLCSKWYLALSWLKKSVLKYSGLPKEY